MNALPPASDNISGVTTHRNIPVAAHGKKEITLSAQSTTIDIAMSILNKGKINEGAIEKATSMKFDNKNLKLAEQTIVIIIERKQVNDKNVIIFKNFDSKSPEGLEALNNFNNLATQHDGKLMLHPQYAQDNDIDPSNHVMIEAEAWQNYEIESEACLAQGKPSPALPAGKEVGIMTDEHVENLSTLIKNCQIEINLMQQLQQRQKNIESNKEGTTPAETETTSRAAAKAPNPHHMKKTMDMTCSPP